MFDTPRTLFLVLMETEDFLHRFFTDEVFSEHHFGKDFLYCSFSLYSLQPLHLHAPRPRMSQKRIV